MTDSNLNNLFQNLPDKISEELITILAENSHVRIERIVSTGHANKKGFWYDQEEHEWVIVLKGEAELVFEAGQSIVMQPGDHQLIPAHQKHRVEWTTDKEPTVWLAVYYQAK
ncbi:cupin domain-containing protein [Rubinisphaera italica]|uniref:Cupin domain protein n=1 Tax=Rubinisphaera italica TaxID=2527969 RepID=A0A5C5XHX9_9PLAN|nr:cupin domain-containing protein [Rubinisphaera italica]TWT61432.1 Cupin domain protein [Rubinisphaera italica]